MRYYIMPSRDIRRNLATEEYLMDHAPLDEPLLLLYIQDPCVIIGRNQNVYEEIDLTYLREQNITLTRRISGGGAVYDDLGNLSFSFVSRKGDVTFGDYQGVTTPILNALKEMGAKDVYAGGRNDLYHEGRKFSGNAMYSKNDRTYSHGTLMYDVDLDVLQQILTVNKEKIASKATPSVRKNVTNLKPLLTPDYQTNTTEAFRDQLILQLYHVDTFSKIKDKVLRLSAEDEREIEALFRKKYANTDWIFGKSPAFELKNRVRIPKVGIVEVQVATKEGRISHIRFLGDFFGSLPVSELEKKLCGKAFRYQAISDVLNTLTLSDYILHLTNEECLSLLFS